MFDMRDERIKKLWGKHKMCLFYCFEMTWKSFLFAVVLET